MIFDTCQVIYKLVKPAYFFQVSFTSQTVALLNSNA